MLKITVGNHKSLIKMVNTPSFSCLDFLSPIKRKVEKITNTDLVKVKRSFDPFLFIAVSFFWPVKGSR